MASPGMHLVMVYDPQSGKIFKKLIAVSMKQKHKDFFPQRIDFDFTKSNSEDQDDADQTSAKEIFPTKFVDIKADAFECFHNDIRLPHLKSFKYFKEKEKDSLLQCISFIYEHYNVFCLAHLQIM